MNYELAKELKDAGFPAPKYFVETFSEDKTYIPTLSELISAIKIPEPEIGFFTLAFIHTEWVAGYEKYEAFHPEAVGATPEEAVARLWLALNKK